MDSAAVNNNVIAHSLMKLPSKGKTRCLLLRGKFITHASGHLFEGCGKCAVAEAKQVQSQLASAIPVRARVCPAPAYAAGAGPFGKAGGA